MSEPTAPRNVRIVRGDEVLPLELVYAGHLASRTDPEEMVHLWKAVTAVYLTNDCRLLIDMLPAHTAIEVEDASCPK